MESYCFLTNPICYLFTLEQECQTYGLKTGCNPQSHFTWPVKLLEGPGIWKQDKMRPLNSQQWTPNVHVSVVEGEQQLCYPLHHSLDPAQRHSWIWCPCFRSYIYPLQMLIDVFLRSPLLFYYILVSNFISLDTDSTFSVPHWLPLVAWLNLSHWLLTL